MPNTLTVVTLLTERKAYCLADLLAAFSALESPAGYTIRFLIVVAGQLSPEHEALLSEFDQAHAERAVRVADIERGPEIVQYEGDTYWCSLTAAELRERARKVLSRRKDTHVLWVDCDVLPPADTLPRLLAHGRALTSGLVLNRLLGSPIAGKCRWDPETPMPAGADWTVVPGGQDVGWVGFGLFLVRGELARDISFTPYLEGAAPVWTGEDGYFCQVATERCGEPVFLDTDLSPWHVDGTGLAVRGDWAEGHLVRALQLLGEGAPGRCCLIPRVSGLHAEFGSLVAGRPFWTDRKGQELSPERMRELAERSQVLDLFEPVA